MNAHDDSGAHGSPGLGEPGTQRPSNSGQGPKGSGPIVDRLEEYFNMSVFSQPEPFPFRNFARTMPGLRRSGVVQIDFSIL